MLQYNGLLYGLLQYTKEQVMYIHKLEKALFSGKTDHIENSFYTAAKENPQTVAYISWELRK